MKRITWVPGAVTAGSNIDLPANSSPIDEVVSAEITRVPSALASASVASTIETPALAHADGATAVTSTAATMPDHAGAACTGDTCAPHTHGGASPVVAATPTKVDENTITLSVDTVLGDLLTLVYAALGERVKV